LSAGSHHRQPCGAGGRCGGIVQPSGGVHPGGGGGQPGANVSTAQVGTDPRVGGFC